ncbi:MAG: STAS domain-containing protein [Anaerolineales bacterium]
MVIAVTVLLFGQFVASLAMPALAGLLIVIGLQTLRLDDIETVWKTGAVQQVVMTITFVSTLIMPLHYAVFLGVAVSIVLYFVSQSNKIVVMEWILERGELPLERPVPDVLPSNQVTILIPYGSLFFATAPTFEEYLPDASAARHAVLIIYLRRQAEVGSTLLDVLDRYLEVLNKNDCKLMVAGVSQTVRKQFIHTGFLYEIGRDNVYSATERFGGSLLHAYDDANRWIEQVSGGKGG